MDKPRKPIVVLAAQVALLIYAATFLSSAPEVYADFFHEQATAVFGWLGERRVVLVVASEGRQGPDTEMIGFEKGRIKARWRIRLHMQENGFWPLVTLAALVCATPLPIGRRILALLGGLVLVNAFTMLQLGTVALSAYHLTDATAAGHPGIWPRVTGAVSASLNSVFPRYLGVMAAWMLCAAPSREIDLQVSRAALRAWWTRSPSRPRTR